MTFKVLKRLKIHKSTVQLCKYIGTVYPIYEKEDN